MVGDSLLYAAFAITFFSCRQVGCKLPDEVGRKFRHGHVRPFVERLDKGCDIVPCPYHHLVCADTAVFTYTFEEVGAILVESLYQRFVLTPYPLIGIAYHFSRDVCLSV